MKFEFKKVALIVTVFAIGVCISSCGQKPQDETAVTAMTDEQMELVQNFLSETENNGFLLSDYDLPKDIALAEVFYNWEGQLRHTLDGDTDAESKEIQAYLEASGCEELYTDVNKITTAEADAFLTEKAGIALSDSTKGLSDWTYLSDYDAYYFMHGDTNYDTVTVLGGNISSDGVWNVSYELEYIPEALESDAKHIADNSGAFSVENWVQLKATDNGFTFISNSRQYINE